jgi:hypothetical protein
MCKQIYLALVLLAFTAKPMCVLAQEETDYFGRNVAIVDAVVKSISEKEYVRVLKLVDFEKAERLPLIIGFDGIPLSDDGKGFDLAAGDGLYTSLATYQHTDEVPYNRRSSETSVLEKVLADPQFSHLEELQEYVNSNTYAGRESGLVTGPGLEISLECDIYLCRCDTPCGGCVFTWGHIGCVSCIKMKNCKVKVSFGW